MWIYLLIRNPTKFSLKVVVITDKYSQVFKIIYFYYFTVAGRISIGIALRRNSAMMRR